MYGRRKALSILSGAILGAAAAETDISPGAFHDEVIAVLRRHKMGLDLQPGRNDGEVEANGHVLYLRNLYRSVRGASASVREKAIVAWFEQFTPSAQARAAAVAAEVESWAGAQPRLRPKLLAPQPPGVADRLVWRPFASNLMLACALDLGDRDLYVTKDRFDVWRVAADAVHQRAIDNLEAMSASLFADPKPEMHAAMYDIALGDGYDAARLVLPGLRTRLSSLLGSPFHAAVPARRMLMCWTPGDATFEARMAGLVRADAASMDHPVSADVYAVDGREVRPV